MLHSQSLDADQSHQALKATPRWGRAARSVRHTAATAGSVAASSSGGVRLTR
jgi:hypothetical protein